MKYTSPEMELVEFDLIDVIQTSAGGNSEPEIDYGENELPKT